MDHSTGRSASSFSNTFIVSPPIRAMPTPVYRDPAQGGAVLTYLKAGTAVQATSQTALWLCIELPGEQRGYIQLSHARPATDDEACAAQVAAPSNGRAARPKTVLTTQEGLTKPRPRRTNFGCTPGLFGLAFLSCVGATALYSIIQQECYYPGGNCVTVSHPFAGIAEALYGISFLVVAIGVIAFVTAFARSRRS